MIWVPSRAMVVWAASQAQRTSVNRSWRDQHGRGVTSGHLQGVTGCTLPGKFRNATQVTMSEPSSPWLLPTVLVTVCFPALQHNWRHLSDFQRSLMSGCAAESIGDGRCDAECRTVECEFDGGDCERSEVIDAEHHPNSAPTQHLAEPMPLKWQSLRFRHECAADGWSIQGEGGETSTGLDAAEAGGGQEAESRERSEGRTWKGSGRMLLDAYGDSLRHSVRVRHPIHRAHGGSHCGWSSCQRRTYICCG